MNEEALERKLDRKQMKKERKGKKSDHCAQNVIRSWSVFSERVISMLNKENVLSTVTDKEMMIILFF